MTTHRVSDNYDVWPEPIEAESIKEAVALVRPAAADRLIVEAVAGALEHVDTFRDAVRVNASTGWVVDVRLPGHEYVGATDWTRLAVHLSDTDLESAWLQSRA